MISRLVAGAVVCCVLAASARGDEQHDQDARRLFNEGRDAFEKHDYQRAYDSFKQSYLLSQRPELLFNMSSALKELERPHDAAEELRAYLRLVPGAVDRAEIEQRILTLEESQRILDRERGHKAPVEKPSERAPAPEPAVTAPAVTAPATPAPAVESAPATSNVLTAAPPEKPKRKLGLAIGLGVAGAVVVGALAVGLGVGLSHGAPSPTSSTFGTIRATP